MRLSYRQELIEFIIKIVIASIAGVIIVFYNVEPIGHKNTEEELYSQIIEKYQYHNSQYIVEPQSPPSSGIIENKVVFSSGWTNEEQDKIKTIVLETLQSINMILSTKDNFTTILQYITINKESSKARGYSTHNSIVINYGDMTEKEFIQVFVHELAHIIDLGILQGTSLVKEKKFTEFGEIVFSEDDPSLGYYYLSWDSEYERKKNIKKYDFCSVYGMSNPFEDFAECVQLYLNHHDYFLTIKDSSVILDKKYMFIEKLFKEQYLHDQIIQIPKDDTNKRYRDSTRIK